MHRIAWSLLVLVAGCEARLSDAPSDGDPGGPTRDAIGDAMRLGPWALPATVSPAATAANEDDVTLSSDGLEMWFSLATATGKDLYYTARGAPGAPWSLAMRVPFDSDDFSEETPRLSADDRTLYFASDRAGNGTLDIYSATRPERGSMLWGTVRSLDDVNTTTLVEKWFMPCGSDGYIMIQSNSKSDTDLVEGKRAGSTPTPIDELNSAGNETGTFVTADCLTIYFASNRAAPAMIYTSHRASLTSHWEPPSKVTDFESIGGGQEDPWLAPDGHTFAFASDASGSKDIYITTR